MKDVWKTTRRERRVQKLMRRRASKQLLAVPWARFREAQTEYLQWEGFSLWVRSVVEAEDRLPSLVLGALKQKCPGFLRIEQRGYLPSLLAVRLDEWIRNHIFGRIKKEGWLDALLFYGVRDVRSQCLWACWEDRAGKWRRKRPARYPTFRSWSHAAYRYEPIPEVSVRRLTAAIETYVGWLSFTRWLLPVLVADTSLPTRITDEVNRKLPGFLDAEHSFARNGRRTLATIELRIMSWIENHYFREAKRGRWLGILRHRVQDHPRLVRITAYADRWPSQGLHNDARTYPSFGHWLEAAENYVERRTKAT